MAVSSLISPENPGTSGMRTTTWAGDESNGEVLTCVWFTLNFSLLRAARMILSTRACAIRFCTGPSFLVLEMLGSYQT